MFRPFGLSVPSSKMSLISWFFRRLLSPLQRLRPQIMMSSSEWGGRVEMFSYRKARENCFERYAGVHWSVPAVASQSHRCTSSRSDDIWWSRPHSRTGKWSGHGWYKGAWDFVRWSEMWCVGTLSSEDDGRQTFRHLRRSFRQSVQGNLLGFCHADRIPEGAQGKLCVSQGRITTFQSCQAGCVFCWTDCRSKPVALYFQWNRVRLLVLMPRCVTRLKSCKDRR